MNRTKKKTSKKITTKKAPRKTAQKKTATKKAGRPTRGKVRADAEDPLEEINEFRPLAEMPEVDYISKSFGPRGLTPNLRLAVADGKHCTVCGKKVKFYHPKGKAPQVIRAHNHTEKDTTGKKCKGSRVNCLDLQKMKVYRLQFDGLVTLPADDLHQALAQAWQMITLMMDGASDAPTVGVCEQRRLQSLPKKHRRIAAYKMAQLAIDQDRPIHSDLLRYASPKLRKQLRELSKKGEISFYDDWDGPAAKEKKLAKKEPAKKTPTSPKVSRTP